MPAWEAARVALPAAALDSSSRSPSRAQGRRGGHAAYGSIALLAGVGIVAWVALSARTWPTAALRRPRPPP